MLWAVAGAIGQRTGVEYTAGMTKAKELEAAGQAGPSAELLAVNRTQRGLWLHATASVRPTADPHRHDLEARRMISVLAAARPDSWNFPLLVHVLGAMILVGGLLTGASAIAFARGDARFLRLGYWTLLAVALPGYIVMRIGAEWMYTKYDWDDLPEGVDEPTWIGDRLHRRRRRRAPHADRADRGRHRRTSPAGRQGRRDC